MTEFTSVVSILSILVGVLAVGVALATVTLTALHRMERRVDQRISQLEAQTNRRIDEFQAQTNQRFDLIDRRIDEFQAQTNQRFGLIDRRIDEFQAQTNQRFGRIDQRFDQTDRRIDHLAERVAGLEVGQARIVGQLDVIRETLFDRAAAVVPE